MADEPDLPGEGAEPGDLAPGRLILTLFGLYARAAGGRLPVAGIVRLMATLGSDAPAVRSAVSRLKRRGVVVPVRDGGAAYALSPAGVAMLEVGDRRIFAAREARLEDGWCLAVFSVPESERDRRHRIRSELAGLGFGVVSPGVAIAPGRLLPAVREALAVAGLSEYVELFRADADADPDAGTATGAATGADALEGLAAKVATWWDLAALDALYRDFVAGHGHLRDAARSRPTPDAAFREYVPMLTRWRRLPYLDPGLPPELLPRPWSGTEARTLFETCSTALAHLAHEHATTCLPDLGPFRP